MNALDYLLKANLYGLLFVGCYWLFLRRHTFFSLNRAYLLLSTVLSLGLPFASLPTKTVETLPQLALPTTFVALPPATVVVPAVDSVSVSSGIDWEQISLIIYGLISLLLLVRLGVRISRLMALIRQSPRRSEDGFVLVQPHDPTLATFSFFQFLVLNPADADNQLILRHELTHIQQWHSADVVGMAILRAIFWAFPTLWLTDRLLRQVHEFLADKQTHQPADYARFLVEYTFGLRNNTLTNGFFNPSFLKLRIQMLHQRTTANWALGKYMLVLPLVFALLAMTTAREEMTSVINQVSDGTVTVSGQVTSAVDRKPLPGVTVFVRKSTQLTSTDSDGRYVLPNVPKDATIEFSFVGFTTQSVPVNAHTAIHVSMAIATKGLDEIVVTAREPDIDSSLARTTAATKPVSGNISTNEVYTVVEQQPEFRGGMMALSQYLKRNLRYPTEAQRSKVQGRVFVQFVVTEMGDIRELRILKGIGFGCDEEAVRVVSQMPKWTSGKQNGKPVSVQYNLPIQFSLEKVEDKRTGQIVPTIPPDSAKKMGFIIDKSKNAPYALYNDVANGDSKERYAIPLPDSLQSPRSSASIRVGGNGLSNGEPLYIVDGVEVPSGGFKKINPDKIESITVLKDASAATYGPKAQDGVIIITTKRK